MQKKFAKFGNFANFPGFLKKMFFSKIVDLDNDFFIDLSNINNIDKIIYRGVEIRLNKELNSYLFNFHIKDLETLL